MKNWVKYYNDLDRIIWNTSKRELHRIPDLQDHKRAHSVHRLSTNLIDIYIDGEFIKTELLIPEEDTKCHK